jgi:hypothetical protein
MTSEILRVQGTVRQSCTRMHAPSATWGCEFRAARTGPSLRALDSSWRFTSKSPDFGRRTDLAPFRFVGFDADQPILAGVRLVRPYATAETKS